MRTDIEKKGDRLGVGGKKAKHWEELNDNKMKIEIDSLGKYAHHLCAGLCSDFWGLDNGQNRHPCPHAVYFN